MWWTQSGPAFTALATPEQGAVIPLLSAWCLPWAFLYGSAGCGTLAPQLLTNPARGSGQQSDYSCFWPRSWPLLAIEDPITFLQEHSRLDRCSGRSPGSWIPPPQTHCYLSSIWWYSSLPAPNRCAACWCCADCCCTAVLRDAELSSYLQTAAL